MARWSREKSKRNCKHLEFEKACLWMMLSMSGYVSATSHGDIRLLSGKGPKKTNGFEMGIRRGLFEGTE